MEKEEDLSVESFRRILHDSGDARRASLLERVRSMNEMCKTADFRDLVAYQEKMVPFLTSAFEKGLTVEFCFQASRLSLTVLQILRTPQESSSESSSQASLDTYDTTLGKLDNGPEKAKVRLEMKVHRGFRRLSSPHLEVPLVTHPGMNDMYAK